MWINYPQTAKARIVALTTISYVHNLNTCKMSKRIEYVEGQMIGELRFVKEADMQISPQGKKRRMAEFKCRCGKIFITYIAAAKRSHTKSCGCRIREVTIARSTKHGDKKRGKQHYLYSLWAGIKTRCYNKNESSYKYWGGRGIIICDLWLNDYPAFKKYILDNLGEKPSKKHSLDRIDNNENYEPGNIRWATDSEQMLNRKAFKLSKEDVVEIKKMLVLETYTQVFIGRKFNVSGSTINDIKHKRIHNHG